MAILFHQHNTFIAPGFSLQYHQLLAKDPYAQQASRQVYLQQQYYLAR